MHLYHVECPWFQLTCGCTRVCSCGCTAEPSSGCTCLYFVPQTSQSSRRSVLSYSLANPLDYFLDLCCSSFEAIIKTEALSLVYIRYAFRREQDMYIYIENVLGIADIHETLTNLFASRHLCATQARPPIGF